MPLYRRQEKNAQILEFKCVEFVEELMYGQWRKDATDPIIARSERMRHLPMACTAMAGPVLC